jgi:hypothetical protein
MQLFPIPNKSSTANVILALIVYKPLHRSMLTYASLTWGYAEDSHLHKLQTLQDNVLGI